MIGQIAIWILKPNSIGIERRAHRASSVARSRGDKYTLEARFREETRVGHAVQGHTAPQTEIGQPGFLMERSRDLHQRVLQHPLYAGCAIGIALSLRRFQIYRFIRAARGAKQIDETR